MKSVLLLGAYMIICSASAFGQSERGSSAWVSEMWAKAREYESAGQKQSALAAYEELTNYGNSDSTRLESARARIRIHLADKGYVEAADVQAEAEKLIRDKNMAAQIIYPSGMDKGNLQPYADAVSAKYADKSGVPCIRLCLIGIYYQLKQNDKARATIGKLYPEINTNPVLLRSLVQFTLQDGTLDLWRVELTRYLVRLVPDDLSYAMTHADACARAKLKAECVQEARRIMESVTGKAVEDQMFLNNAASSCALVGAYDDAIDLYKRSLELFGERNVLWNIADTYERAGRKPEAINAYEDVIERAPNETLKKWAQEALTRLRSKAN